MDTNDSRHFQKMYESRKSIRAVEVVSEESSGYEISPYSIRKEEPLDMNKIIAGVIFCFLGMVTLAIGVKKQMNNHEADESKY